MSREYVPTYERRQIRYENVAMAFDGDGHELVERVDDAGAE